MRISAYILPRRVILALLLFLGLYLRLWGLAWNESGAAPDFYPEWGSEVIASLSWLNPVFREDFWTQAFFALAALLKGGVAGLGGWVEVWLGQARVSTEVSLNPVLAGRLAVALLGVAQIWLAYQVGRRWFDSLGTGLLAAAWLTVSPLMVMESHYLDLGIPLGFISLCLLWSVHALEERPGFRRVLLSSLCMGLALTFKASALLLSPLWLGGLFLAWRRLRPSWRGLLLGGLGALAGLWLGLSAGSPGFILFLFRMDRNILDSLAWPVFFTLPWEEAWTRTAERGEELLFFLRHWLGWHWLILWLAGLVILFRQRRAHALAPAFFPPLYLGASLFLLQSPLENLLAAVMPLFILLAVWPLVLVCRKIPGRLWPAWAVGILGLALCAAPLLNSLRVSYLFWQQPARQAALTWISDNQYPSSSFQLLPAGEETPPGFVQVKRFDLSGDWAPAWLDRAFKLSRAYGVYAPTGGGPTGSASGPLSLPLYLARPAAAADALFRTVMGGQDAYNRDEGALFLDAPGIRQRLLRLNGAGEPLELKVTVRNLGTGLALAGINQGPWFSQTLTLYPGQQETVYFAASPWPPLLGGSYPFSVRLYQGEKLWANWQWRPLLQGGQSLEEEDWRQTERRLENVNKPEARVMQALALTKNGAYREAEKALAGLDQELPYLRLPPEFHPLRPEELEKFTGLDPLLMEKSWSVFYALAVPDETGHIALSGSGFSGSIDLLPAAGEERWISLALNDRLPRGFWLLNLWLENWHEETAVKLFSRDPLQDRLLFSGQVLPQPDGKVAIPFAQPANGAEIRLNMRLNRSDTRLKAFSLSSDLRACLRAMADYYWQARAEIHFAEKDFNRTLEDLAAISAPLPEDLLLMRAVSLLGTAQSGQAEESLDYLRSLWRDQPQRLSVLRGLYAALGREEKTSEIDRRLAALRPSISRYARFQGGMGLLGYDWSEERREEEESITFRLYWQAWDKPLLNSEVMLTAAGPAGLRQPLFRLTEEKIDLTGLKPGQVLVEEWRADGLQPGAYRFSLRLADSYRNGQSLNVIEGGEQEGNELLLFNLEIK
ncbi:MAG: glycosyltransferase family 39 protein [Desulfarculales bacterium]|nr:glycosyltransferase family 39 protein [Desulfarculales bacterium]